MKNIFIQFPCERWDRNSQITSTLYASWYFEIDDASVDIYISISSEHLLFLDKRAVVFQVQDRQQFTLAKLLSTTPNMD